MGFDGGVGLMGSKLERRGIEVEPKKYCKKDGDFSDEDKSEKDKFVVGESKNSKLGQEGKWKRSSKKDRKKEKSKWKSKNMVEDHCQQFERYGFI